jgi:streptogramin lyase
VGLVEAQGDLWFAADGGHIIRIEPAGLTATDVALDPKRFSGKVGLAGDGVAIWVTGADDHSIGLLDPSSLAVSRIPAITTQPMVIDKIDGAAAEEGRLWFFADVHASQDILGTPCCNGFTSTMLYSATVESDTMTQVQQLASPLAIGAGFGAVWVLARPDGSDAPAVLDRLYVDLRDPAATIATRLPLPAVGSGFTPCGACIATFLVGSNSVWVPTGLGKSLLRIEPETGRVVASIDFGRDVSSVVEAPDGYIWVAGGGAVGAACDPDAGYVAVIDPSTNRIIRESHVACPISLVVHDGDVWVGIDSPSGPLVEQIQRIH